MRSVPLRSPHTPVRQSSNSFSPIWSRLIALALSYGLVGWVLSAYTVSKLVWLGTLAATFYLAWVGPGAIVLSSFWVVGIVAIASPQHPWFTRLPAPSFQIIPFVLLVNCLFALGLIGLLANTYDCLRQSRFRRNLTFYTLLFPALLGLITGGFIYHMFTVPSI